MTQKAVIQQFKNTRMYTGPQKPKLIYFQNKYESALPEFLLNHKQEHVRCLSYFFDVVVIHDDCDYQQVCDLHQPDIALFESGVNLFTCRKPRITNVRSSRSIPKLALLNADAWCETRTGSFADLELWDVDAVFSIAATAVEHMPEISDELFIWPNSIDPEIYRDYQQEKLIPVLLSGATAALYPWRRRVYRLISQHYPTLSCPHRGYLSRTSPGQVFAGEAYARLLNAAKVSPACGTVGGEVVRKHFEIPACNTCLITEETVHIKQAGFVDMKNCVFGDSHDLLDKLELLFSNEEQLQRVTAEGHNLVHASHTMKQRDQILQWYRLNKELPSGHRIIQPDPFRPLQAVAARQNESLPPAISNGKHLLAMREGNLLLRAGDIAAARAKYRLCLSYMHRFPEARFKIALCDLYAGNASAANAQIFELIQYCLGEYGASTPDPVEWAYYILSLMCTGDVRGASRYAEEFPMLGHPEMDRVRLLFCALNRTGDCDKFDSSETRNPSIHQCPEQTDTEWLQALNKTLRTCGQDALAERITVAMGRMKLSANPRKQEISLPARRRIVSVGASAPAEYPGAIPGKSSTLNRKLLQYRVERKMTQLRKHLKARRLLPIRRGRTKASLSAGQTALLASIRETTRDLQVRSALICGDMLIDEACAAVNEGAIGRSSPPAICCLRDRVLHASGENTGPKKSIDPVKDPIERDQAKIVQEFKASNAIESFDLIFVARSGEIPNDPITEQIIAELQSARCLAFADPENASSRQIIESLIAKCGYVVSDRDGIEASYVILMKSTPPHQAFVCAAGYERENCLSQYPLSGDASL